MPKSKKLSKSGNLSKISTKKPRPIFVIPDTKVNFNYL